MKLRVIAELLDVGLCSELPMDLDLRARRGLPDRVLGEAPHTNYAWFYVNSGPLQGLHLAQHPGTQHYDMAREQGPQKTKAFIHADQEGQIYRGRFGKFEGLDLISVYNQPRYAPMMREALQALQPHLPPGDWIVYGDGLDRPFWLEEYLATGRRHGKYGDGVTGLRNRQLRFSSESRQLTEGIPPAVPDEEEPAPPGDLQGRPIQYRGQLCLDDQGMIYQMVWDQGNRKQGWRLLGSVDEPNNRRVPPEHYGDYEWLQQYWAEVEHRYGPRPR